MPAFTAGGAHARTTPIPTLAQWLPVELQPTPALSSATSFGLVGFDHPAGLEEQAAWFVSGQLRPPTPLLRKPPPAGATPASPAPNDDAAWRSREEFRRLLTPSTATTVPSASSTSTIIRAVISATPASSPRRTSRLNNPRWRRITVRVMTGSSGRPG